jgi:hypothetical protein
MSTIVYNGYRIGQATPSGGKAGRGCNVTSSIQVRVPNGPDGSYPLKKEFRYRPADPATKFKAIDKAKAYIDSLRS